MVKMKGVGMAAIFYGTGYGNGYKDTANAWLELDSEGTVTVYVGAADCGQGSSTILCQIAAETLGVAMHQVQIVTEDTDVAPDAGTTAATRQTYTSGNAVKEAAMQAKAHLLDLACMALPGSLREDLEIVNGYVQQKEQPSCNIPICELAKKAQEEGRPIVGSGSFTTQTTVVNRETGEGAPYWPYTFAVQIAEVEVDTRTGKVDVIKIIAANDVGKAIHPGNIQGQMTGGIGQGVGMALLEEVELTQGCIKNPDFAKYIMPTSMDMPAVETIIVEANEPTGPFGAKGVGETCLLPTAPAILNAIYDAIGIRFTSLPVTPEKIVAALTEKKQDTQMGGE